MIGDLTNHLWQSTLFALAAALAAAALRENRAHVRYWVWFAASVKFFVPFSLLVSAGSGWRWTLTATEFGAPAVQAVSLALVHMTQPFPHSAATAETHSNQGTEILFAVWVCGFSWIAGRRWKEWRRIRAAIRSSGPATFRTGMETGARVLSGPGLREPAVAGLRRPVLLLPAGLEDCLTPAQLEAVLTHELCHVRRKDNITAAIHMAAEAVFWFHPLIWWIGARLLAERERACDEHVLQALKQPLVYAAAIASVCRLYMESPLACAPGVSGADIRKRVEDIMNDRVGARLSFARKAALALSAAFAMGTPMVMGVMSRPLAAQSIKRAKDPLAMVRVKETVLKYALFQMREGIDEYHQKNGRYPSSLARLVSEGYLTQIPADPFTNRTDTWKLVPPKAAAGKPATGVYDVMSGSEATALDGTKRADW